MSDERQDSPAPSPFPSVRIVNTSGNPNDTEVYLDGVRVPALHGFSLAQKAGELPVLTVEVYPGIVEMELPSVVLAALDASRADEDDDRPGDPYVGELARRRGEVVGDPECLISEQEMWSAFSPGSSADTSRRAP